MRTLKNLTDAQVGQRLLFVYYGGSNPGAYRDVTVTEVKDDRIVATDHDRNGEIRSFLTDQATMIQVVSEATTPITKSEYQRTRSTSLSFVEARQRLHEQIDALSAEDLAEALAEIDGADQGTFDPNTGLVTLQREVPAPHFQLNLTGDKAGVDIVNEDGETITIVTSEDNGMVTITCNGQEVDPEEFALAIYQHLGLTK